jgi:hypothetical protein
MKTKIVKAKRTLTVAQEKYLRERLAGLTGTTVEAIIEAKKKEKKRFTSMKDALEDIKNEIKKK